MEITEPKRIFDSELKLTENAIANTGDKKWIISDLWISNSADVERKVTLKAGHQGQYDEIKRTLLSDVSLQPKQTVILGNIILETNETLYAYADGEVYAHYNANSDGDNNDLIFVAKESGTSGNNITLEILNPQVVNSNLTCAANGTDISISLATDGTTTPFKASLETTFIDPNNDVVFTSKAFGADSNSISIEMVKDGVNKILTVTDNADDVDWKVKVSLGTDKNGNIITTATDLVTAINSNSQLVQCALATSNDGTGFVRVLAPTNLSGGVDATVTTTANDIIDLLKTNKTLDELVLIKRANSNSGEGTIKHITVGGTHSNKINLSKGDVDKYDPQHYGITGITVIGYGRVI